MIEEWKKVEENSDYEVSNRGQVRSLKFGKIRPLKGSVLPTGYVNVTLCSNGKETGAYVHRLVAKAFLPNPSKYLTVNHKDGNKQNNLVDNLEWCTIRDNVQHALDTGLNRVVGEDNGNATLTEEEVRAIRILYEIGIPNSVLARVFKVRDAAISKICLNQLWKHVS